VTASFEVDQVICFQRFSPDAASMIFPE